MAVSSIQQSSQAVTDTTLPILYRDPLLNTGSQFLFDFLNPFSDPNADGNLGAGATFANLVDGGAAATILAGATSGGFANLTGKAGLSSSGGNNSTLDLGALYDMSFSGTPHSFLAVQWFKIPASGYTTTNYTREFGSDGYTSSTNAAQWGFDCGPGGLQPRGFIANGSASQVLTLSSGSGQGTPCQIGLLWTPGSMTLYKNGAVNSSTTNSVPTTLTTPTVNVQLRNGVNGTFYRAWLEDLTVSAAAAGLSVTQQAAAQIAADYAANASRFT